MINVHVLLVPFKPYNVSVYGINIDGKGIRRTVINFTREGSKSIHNVCIYIMHHVQ